MKPVTFLGLTHKGWFFLNILLGFFNAAVGQTGWAVWFTVLAIVEILFDDFETALIAEFEAKQQKEANHE